MLTDRWRIEMLGGLRATLGEQRISQFRTRKVAALLAYLAFDGNRPVPRESLIELFWPDEQPEAGRNSLRVALASLRRQLEPPGISAGTVLRADRMSVQLNSASVTVDVSDFRQLLHAAGDAPSHDERIPHLVESVEIYRGELLAGLY